MMALIDAARQQGFKCMTGEILADNRNMRSLVEKLGFHAHTDPADIGLVLVELPL